MNDKTKVTVENYDKTVEEYYVKSLSMSKPKYVGEFLDMLSREAKILDMGCGFGRDTKYISEKGFDIIGIDLSDGLLNKGKVFCPNCKLLKMDMRKLDFEDGYFDAIWSWASLLHIPRNEILDTLEGAFRVLKKEGIIHIVTKKGSKEEWYNDTRYKNKVRKFQSYYEIDEMCSYLEEIGFKILKTDEFEIDSEYVRDSKFILIICKK